MSRFKFSHKFIPKGKSFIFNFNKDTCAKIRYGFCPLFLVHFSLLLNLITKIETKKSYRKKYHLSYCSNLSKVVNSTYQLERIFIYRFKCKHYSFISGQHRTCISGKLGTTVQTNIKKMPNSCNHCSSSKNSKPAYKPVTFSK